MSKRTNKKPESLVVDHDHITPAQKLNTPTSQLNTNLNVQHTKSPQPKTPYFYRSRESLLESELEQENPQEKQEEEPLKDAKECNRHRYDGFFNLCVVMLIGSCTVLCVDNYLNKGLLVDLDLLKCMTADAYRSYLLAPVILGYAVFIFFLSQVNMRFIYQGQITDEKGRIIRASQKTPSRTKDTIYLLCNVLYLSGLFSVFYTVVHLIFAWRVSILISFVVSLCLMVVTFKMHSYYVYIGRSFTPNAVQVPTDEHINHSTLVTLNEFTYFMVAPTMCFFRYYPRTDSIRVGYLVKQALSIIACLSIMYVMCMQFLDPVLKMTSFSEADVRTAYLVLKVSLPWFIIWLLGSYAFFHCWLNIVAELTMFADRLWYKDWWNAPTFDEFWRMWNIPTHHFLLRHVYFASLRYKWSKSVALWLTFFLSAFVHELCMSIVFRTLRYYFFLAMMLQIPFVSLAERFKNQNKRLGNCLMWMSLFTGQPLMVLLYFKDWYSQEMAMCEVRYN
ncbi:diacylglycerol O-acyltransferase [Acrasis kona]|uniref:O-acyltransferase n=1 Tax=Acrasis kona TaxID=1008807 RepID=A0AAW2ZNS1_9EUKA